MAIIPDNTTQTAGIETLQQQKTKERVYLLVLVLIIGAAITYFGFGGFSKKPIDNIIISAELEQIEKESKFFDELRNVKLDNLIFSDKQFKELIQVGQYPISIGQKGRQNPFAPY